MRPSRTASGSTATRRRRPTFYCSVFPDAEVTGVQRYTEAGPGRARHRGHRRPGASAIVEFVGINGGPQYTFTPAISFVAECEDQAEVDRLWDALLADGGKPSMCGWLEDRFGVSWQVVPHELYTLIQHPDAAAAMLQMVKIDLAELRRAAGAG